MKGSDIVYYESAHPDTLTDAFATDKAMPTADDCQDWSLVQVHHDGGFLIVEAMRRLDTLDVTNDHAVINDADTRITAQRVIFAWGDQSTVTFHGTNQARGGIRWYGEMGDEVAAFRRRMSERAEGYFDLGPRNHVIEAVETAYVNFCFSWSDILDFIEQGLRDQDPTGDAATGRVSIQGGSEAVAQKVRDLGRISLIGVEMRLDPIGGKFVHHAGHLGSIKPSNGSQSCDLAVEDFTYPLFGWAPGTMPFVLPPDVGFTLGPGADSNGIQSFKIEIHYHNPELIAGATDSGGLRLYYVTEPLQHELGILFLADILKNMKGQKLGNGLSEFEFDCSSECSTLALVDEPVTVVQEYFHMHQKGTGAVQMQIRNGQVIRQATTNYFEFAQSGLHAVRQAPFQILPGDSFRTFCYYQNADDTTMFGLASSDEMCEGTFLYYPAKRMIGDWYPWICTYDISVEVCNATFEYTLRSPNETFFCTFGINPVSDKSEPQRQCLDKLMVQGPSDSTVKTSGSALPLGWFGWKLALFFANVILG